MINMQQRASDQWFGFVLILGSFYPPCQRKQMLLNTLIFHYIHVSTVPVNTTCFVCIALDNDYLLTLLLWECFIWQRVWSHIQISCKHLISVNTKSITGFGFLELWENWEHRNMTVSYDTLMLEQFWTDLVNALIVWQQCWPIFWKYESFLID